MKSNLSKTQVEIEELAKRVPQLTEKQREWAMSNFKYIVPMRVTNTCPNCHNKVQLARNEELRCPHCGALISQSAYGTKSVNHQEQFFQVMDVVGGWQVSRLFYMQRYCYSRKENSPMEFHEVCQAWNKPDVAITHFRSYPKCGIMCHYRYNPYSLYQWELEENPDEETFHSYRAVRNNLEARVPGGANYFDLTNLCPNPRILPFYRRKGLTAEAFRKIKTYGAMALMEGANRNRFAPMLETLIKGKGYEVFNKITDNTYLRITEEKKNAYYTAWKICQRNHYNYKRNASEWLDVVSMLCDLGLDFHSPHYVCPDNLHLMHQRLVRLSDRKEEQKVLMSKASENARYKKRINPYLKLEFKDSDLTIKVLPDIPAFKTEAQHLGHCVYTCAYYNKENSLILSARGKKGKRWETIEVSLTDFKILQCYGYGDKFTARHKEIIDLVMNNMWQIKEIRNRKKNKRGRKIAA